MGIDQLLRKKNLAPGDVGKLVIIDYVEALKNYSHNPRNRGGILSESEKALAVSRATDPDREDREDFFGYLWVRDFVDDLHPRLGLALLDYDLSCTKLEKILEDALLAESMNEERIRSKKRMTGVDSRFFDLHRVEAMINKRNTIKALVESIRKDYGILLAIDATLEGIKARLGIDNIDDIRPNMPGADYRIYELMEMVEAVCSIIHRDGKEDLFSILPDALLTNPMSALEMFSLCDTSRVPAAELVLFLRDNIRLDFQVSEHLEEYRKGLRLRSLKKYGVREVEMLASMAVTTSCDK